MKKLNFKQKKYVLPLLALPFLLLFVYVGAQFTKDEKSKEKPKELSLSLGETRDSIMTKNDAYDALFQKDDNRTMLGGLDKERVAVHVAEGSDGGVDAAGDDGARAGEELGGLIHVLREAKRANLEKGLPSLKWVLFPNQY